MSRVTCNQCELVAINSLVCHELGCPNAHSRWDSDSRTWIKQRECVECGCTVDAADDCCPDVEPDMEYST